jgi:hypothetical protein
VFVRAAVANDSEIRETRDKLRTRDFAHIPVPGRQFMHGGRFSTTVCTGLHHKVGNPDYYFSPGEICFVPLSERYEYVLCQECYRVLVENDTCGS